MAAHLGVSPRHVRRAVRSELGVAPVTLAQTRRLLLAKQLIADTDLPLTRVAFASGFGSVRRFNALFRARYKLAPSAMRRGAAVAADRVALLLDYRPPLAWDCLLRSLAARATHGVEAVAGGAYRRTLAVGPHVGWVEARPAVGREALRVELAAALVPALPELLPRLRDLFDLDARPDRVADHLATVGGLAPLVAASPGVRVAGAVGVFEVAVRAVLGQRISVRAASTLAGRLARAFGTPVETPFPDLTHASPTPAQLAIVDPSAIAALGVAPKRAAAIVTLAQEVVAGRIAMHPHADPARLTAQLEALPGIGPWTAGVVALRGLRSPDAFPVGDLVLRRVWATRSTESLEAASEAWRPWRGYAAAYLWANAGASRE